MTNKKAGGGDDANAHQDPSADPVMSQLKEMYDSVAKEPLPQDLLALLDKLDKAERSR